MKEREVAEEAVEKNGTREKGKGEKKKNEAAKKGDILFKEILHARTHRYKTP